MRQQVEGMARVVAAFNVRGALGSEGGLESHEGRILKLTAEMHAKGVVVAVLGEPRFGPGFRV